MKRNTDPFHILIVDDDPLQLPLLTKLLQNRLIGNVKVDATTNTQKAIGLAISGKVDVCITDLDMPDRNGTELLRALKGHDPLTLVIMLTAIDSESALRTSLSYGADDYLLKPVQWESLLNSVQFQISRLQRYRTEVEYISNRHSEKEKDAEKTTGQASTA